MGERVALVTGGAAGIGTPGDVADAVAYLASDGASYMHGSTLVVDGGVTA